jgi:hypothetical protein
VEDELLVYKVDPDAFTDDSTHAPWTFNKKFSGINQSKVQNPANDIIVYSSVPNKEGFYYCLYADGHADKLDGDQWEEAKATRTVVTPNDSTLEPL